MKRRKENAVKIVILTNTDHYDSRAKLIYDQLCENNEVTVFSTDFVHAKKIHRAESAYPEFILFPTKAYKKNLSVGRLLSHWDYPKRAFREVEKYSPDLIYVMLPSNSNVYRAVKYQKKHPRTRLVFDIIDMWPESFPIAKLSWIPLFKIWRDLRDKNICKAELVVSECGLYFDILGKKLDSTPKKVLYFAKPRTSTDKTPNLPVDEINLCYLGAANNIIDIPFIAAAIKEIASRKKTNLHIIGKGERMQEFIDAATQAGAAVIDHGVIYDTDEKQKIFNICHFGINAMRDTVCVGLTMKSVDYFDAGLPLLNNIKGDTTRFVEQYGAGFNLNYENMSAVAEKISTLSEKDFTEMRSAALKVFNENLSQEVFNSTLSEIKQTLEIK